LLQRIRKFMNLGPGPSSYTSTIALKVLFATVILTAVVQGQNPVGFWTFNEGSGTTAADSSGNGHTATLVNGVSWVAGQIGEAVSANAAKSQYVNIPSINLSNTNAVTVAFWSKRTYSTSGGHVLLEATSNYNNSTTGFGFFPDDSDCKGIQAALHGNSGYTAMCYKQPTSNVWHHLAVVYDKSKAGASEVTLYIDGAQQTPSGDTFTSDNTNNFGNNSIYLFARGGTSEFDSGAVDDLRLYSTALTAAQVKQIYNSGTCQLTATPSSIAFANTTVGYTLSYPASIVSNCPTTVTITSSQTSGPEYSTSGFLTPFSLSPGQTQNYTAVFAPTAAGTQSGTLTFVSNAAADPQLSVSLNGTGVSPPQGQLSLSPTTLSFGNVTVNSAQSQTATITNTGAASTTVSAVSVAGTGFSLGSVTTPFTIASQQTAPLTLVFSPTTSGSASGTLTISSNAQNGNLTIPLNGTGVATKSVALSWNATGSQLAGFNVYRSTVSGGPYGKINGTLVAPATYTDPTVLSGTTYYYAVTEVGTNGMESAYSNQAAATVQ
jgi:hypothetical protein